MELTIEQVAALAWNLTKDDADPLFHLCQKTHQDKLVYHAQDVQRGGPADDAFEAKVKDVLANPDAARLEMAEKLYPTPIEITPETTVENVSLDIQPPQKSKAATPKTKKEK